MKKYGVNKGIIIYDGEENTININNKKILLYPILKTLFKFKIQNKKY